jgi:TM2 domain-containing membrane protein YozV
MTALVLGGGALLLWPYLKPLISPQAGAGGFWDVGPSGTSSPFLAPGRAPTGAPGFPGFPGAGQTLAQAGAAGFAAAGPIGAGAMIAAAAVGSLGWGRGGEEGVAVNPARDTFLAQFASLDPTRDARNPPGFYGLYWILRTLDATTGQALFDALTRADTMAEFQAAVGDITTFLDRHQATVQYYVGGGLDKALNDLYLKYYKRPINPDELAAHRGNPGGPAAVEQMLIESLR